jgi:adenosylmethionine-8-amino-7-oxononanoate aminotransferase
MAKVSLKDSYQYAETTHTVPGMAVPSQWAKTGSKIYVEGSGAKLTAIDGAEYLDATSCGLTNNIGYGNEELAEVAKAQMIKLYHVPNFGGRVSIPFVELTRKLAEISPMQRFLIENSGSEVVDAAFKVARLYWREKGRDKFKIISLERAYHGVTFGALSALGVPIFACPSFGPLVPGFISIPTPYCYLCPLGKSYPSCGIDCAQALERIIEKEGENTVAAFIGEPVQGGGGCIVPPPEYWPKIREICTRHNVLLIIDEVITGFGRTGKFWGHEHWGIKPDLMTMAKGLACGYMPIAALGMTEEVYKSITQSDNFFLHIHTFGGHSVACAVALKNIEIILRENLTERAAKMGAYYQERMAAIEKKSPYVGDAHGIGMWGRLQLVANKRTKERFDPKKQVGFQVVARLLSEKRVLVGSFGDDIVMGGLPLTSSKEELDYLIDVFEWAIGGIQP